MIKRSLGKEVFVRTFWDSYDFLGRLIFINLVGMLGIYITQLIAQFYFPKVAQSQEEAQNIAILFPLYTIITGSIVLCFWSSGLIRFLREVSKGTEPSSKVFWKKSYRPSKSMILFWVLLPLLLVYFYVSHLAFSSLFRQMPGGDFIYAFTLGISFWVTVLVVFRLFSRIWFQEMGIHFSIKDSFLIIIKYARLHFNFVMFLFLLGVVIYFTKLAVLVIFGFVLPVVFYNALMQVLQENEVKIHEELLDKEKATSWKERDEIETKKESTRMTSERYERSFRDILKPWGDHDF